MGSGSVACFSLALFMNSVVLQAAGLVSNPTGSCKAKDNGARARYHLPGADDTYLPDCNAPLNREYWRVFAVSESSAYVIPRMDSFDVAKKYGMCAAENELSSLFKKYGLCKEMLNAADIKVLNNMKPAEALNITHALHESLCFENLIDDISNVWQITPFGPDDDIHEVCTKNTDARALTYCHEHTKQFDCTDTCTDAWGKKTDMHVAPSKEVNKVIAPGLNKLYSTKCADSKVQAGASSNVQPGAGTPGAHASRSQFAAPLTSLLIIAVSTLLHQMPLHA